MHFANKPRFIFQPSSCSQFSQCQQIAKRFIERKHEAFHSWFIFQLILRSLCRTIFPCAFSKLWSKQKLLYVFLHEWEFQIYLENCCYPPQFWELLMINVTQYFSCHSGNRFSFCLDEKPRVEKGFSLCGFNPGGTVGKKVENLPFETFQMVFFCGKSRIIIGTCFCGFFPGGSTQIFHIPYPFTERRGS